MNNFIEKIYRSKQTIFTVKEIAFITEEKNSKNMKAKLSYYTKKGKLRRVRKGIYAIDEKYNKDELATKIYIPSYISFETVLSREGVVFQYDSSIYVASYLSREMKVENTKIIVEKIKNEALLNQKGIVNTGAYYIASKERAFLDRVYLSSDYYFDNLSGIDWDVCFDLVSLYENKSLKRKINKYYKENVK